PGRVRLTGRLARPSSPHVRPGPLADSSLAPLAPRRPPQVMGGGWRRPPPTPPPLERAASEASRLFFAGCYLPPREALGSDAPPGRLFSDQSVHPLMVGDRFHRRKDHGFAP